MESQLRTKDPVAGSDAFEGVNAFVHRKISGLDLKGQWHVVDSDVWSTDEAESLSHRDARLHVGCGALQKERSQRRL